jgi:hypothetical protein
VAIAVPSFVLAIAVRRHNRSLPDARARGGPSLLAPVATAVALAGALGSLLTLAAGPAGASIEGPCGGEVGGTPFDAVPGTERAAITLDRGEPMTFVLRSLGPVEDVRVRVLYGGHAFSAPARVSSPSPNVAHVVFEPGDVDWMGAGLYELRVVASVPGAGSCEAAVTIRIDAHPLATTTGRVAAAFAVLGAVAVGASSFPLARAGRRGGVFGDVRRVFTGLEAARSHRWPLPAVTGPPWAARPPGAAPAPAPAAGWPRALANPVERAAPESPPADDPPPFDLDAAADEPVVYVFEPKRKAPPPGPTTPREDPAEPEARGHDLATEEPGERAPFAEPGEPWPAFPPGADGDDPVRAWQPPKWSEVDPVMRELARRGGGTGEDPPIEASPALSDADAEPDAAPPAAPFAAADPVEEAADPVSSLLAWYGSRAAPEPEAAGSLDHSDGPPAPEPAPEHRAGNGAGPEPEPELEPEPSPAAAVGAPAALVPDAEGAGVLGPSHAVEPVIVDESARAAHARWADPHTGGSPVPDLDLRLRRTIEELRLSPVAHGRLVGSVDPTAVRASVDTWVARIGRPPALLREASAVRSAPPEAVPGALLAQSTYLAGIAARASEATTLDDRYDWDLLVEEVQWPWA